jgi:putative flippase GtrA
LRDLIIILNLEIKKYLDFFSNHKKIIFRHLFVSGICASTELLLFGVLFKMCALSLTISYLSSFSVATIIGYILHSYFTFSVGKISKRSAIYFLFQASSILLLGYCIFITLIFCGIYPIIAKIIQLIITFNINVLFGRNLTFRKINV